MEGSPRDLRKSATKRDFLATKPNAWEVKMLRSDLSILIVAFLFALPLIAGEPHHLKIIKKDKFHIPTFLLYQLYQLICLLFWGKFQVLTLSFSIGLSTIDIHPDSCGPDVSSLYLPNNLDLVLAIWGNCTYCLRKCSKTAR